jgi:hypothetical protein
MASFLSLLLFLCWFDIFVWLGFVVMAFYLIHSQVETSIKSHRKFVDFMNVDMKKLPEKIYQHTCLSSLRLCRTLEVLPVDLCQRLVASASYFFYVFFI